MHNLLSDTMCGSGRCPSVWPRPFLLPLLEVSCLSRKSKCLHFGRKYLCSEILLGWYCSSICSFSSYSGPNAYACTPGKQWFTGLMGLKWKESATLSVSCRIRSTEKKETICTVNLLSCFESLDISRLVLSLVQWHYLDIHWSPTMREGGRRTNVLGRGEACQHLKHRFATTSKLFPLTHFNCRHGHL